MQPVCVIACPWIQPWDSMTCKGRWHQNWLKLFASQSSPRWWLSCSLHADGHTESLVIFSHDPFWLFTCPALEQSTLASLAQERNPVKALTLNPNFQKGPSCVSPKMQFWAAAAVGGVWNPSLDLSIAARPVNLCIINLPDGKMRRHPSKDGCALKF